MPRLTAQVWDRRRRHVLESAWRCFARRGFHATTMDEVIRESGWSPSVVYRYVDGKDELIQTASSTAFHALKTLINELAFADPTPTPAQTVAAIVDLLDDERHRRTYSLAGLIVHCWAEAIDDRRIADRGRASWGEIRLGLAQLVQAWQESGAGRVDARPHGRATDLTDAFTLIIPSLIVDTTFLGGQGTAALLRLLASLTASPQDGSGAPDQPVRPG